MGMLAPDNRALLLDALRPPLGHSLDRAVATTFTLDLETALMVPLAFAGFRFDENPDPIEIMEALRRMSERLDIFCQAGAISARQGGRPIWWLFWRMSYMRSGGPGLAASFIRRSGRSDSWVHPGNPHSGLSCSHETSPPTAVGIRSSGLMVICRDGVQLPPIARWQAFSKH